MGGLLSRLLATLYSKKIECVLVGLENSGKTTLLNVIADGYSTETCPTIGLDVKQLKRKGTKITCWDMGGQRQFRDQWVRYTRGADCLLYCIDCSDFERIPEARKELHRLLEDRELARVPILIAANKIDMFPHMGEVDLIRELNLDYLSQPWLLVPISALKMKNIDQVIEWLVRHGK